MASPHSRSWVFLISLKLSVCPRNRSTKSKTTAAAAAATDQPWPSLHLARSTSRASRPRPRKPTSVKPARSTATSRRWLFRREKISASWNSRKKARLRWDSKGTVPTRSARQLIAATSKPRRSCVSQGGGWLELTPGSIFTFSLLASFRAPVFWL